MRLGGALRDGVLGLLRAVVSALGRCLRGMRQSALIQFVAIGTVALLLLLCGVLRLCGLQLQRLGDQLGRKVEMIVYLNDGVSAARAQKIAEVLGKLPGVAEVRPVTSHEAYERLRRSLGDRGELLDGVEEELLPASIEVSFKGGVSDILRVHPLYSRLRATEGVEDVELMGEWVRRLLLAQRLLQWLGFGVGLLAGVVCLCVVAGTIRLGVYARRDEIEVLKLVGATDLHVSAPFLLEGLLQGLMGTAMAVAVLYGVFVLVQPAVQGALRELGAEVTVVFLPWQEVVGAMGVVAVLGMVGSAFAVGKHVRV